MNWQDYAEQLEMERDVLLSQARRMRVRLAIIASGAHPNPDLGALDTAAMSRIATEVWFDCPEPDRTPRS